MQVVELVDDLLLGDEVVVPNVSFEVPLEGHAVAHDALEQLLLARLLLLTPIFDHRTIRFLDPHCPASELLISSMSKQSKDETTILHFYNKFVK